jgi:hypothetical protein
MLDFRLQFFLKFSSVLNLKTQSNFNKLFVAFLLTIFVLGKGFSLIHAFNHSQNNFSKKEISHQNCEICAFANFQKQSSTTPSLEFFAAFLCVIFALHKFNRVKLSHLFLLKSPRAPPAVS